MRIAIGTATRRRVGGMEEYLDTVIAALVRGGHEVALWHESEGPRERPPISLPTNAPVWSRAEAGDAASLAGLAEWCPDVVYIHGIQDPALEELVMRAGPAVMFAHAYHGTCISGSKSRLSPLRAPCPRPLGVPCLVHYLPRRCGGLSPVTMVREYGVQIRRRSLFTRYRAIVTGSAHMRAEFVRNGADPARVHTLTFPVVPEDRDAESAQGTTQRSDGSETGNLGRRWRLMFAGRLTRLKGVHVLFDAIPIVRRSFSGSLQVTIAGDGPALADLQRRAEKLLRRSKNVAIEFTGWLSDAQWRGVARDHDLLVVPSVWPEPYGLVGPEAGLIGLPAAAFAVGGIPDWLADGVNGHLAPGRRPTADGLARAIVSCLADPDHYAALERGARSRAMQLTVHRHVDALLSILVSAAAGVGILPDSDYVKGQL